MRIIRIERDFGTIRSTTHDNLYDQLRNIMADHGYETDGWEPQRVQPSECFGDELEVHWKWIHESAPVSAGIFSPHFRAVIKKVVN